MKMNRVPIEDLAAGRWTRNWTMLFLVLGVMNWGSGEVWAQVSPGPPSVLNSNGTTDTGDDWSPQLTTDGAGIWAAVWYSDENLNGDAGTDYDIFMSWSQNNGATWGAARLLNTTGIGDVGDDHSADVTTDGQGAWICVWSSDENLNGTAGTDRDIFVSRSHDNGATWTDPALLNTNGNSDTGDDWTPQLTTDGAGTWAVIWSSHEDLNTTAGTDRDIFVSWSHDVGVTWSDPELLNSSGMTDVGGDWSPQLTTDSNNIWVAAWYSDENLHGIAGADLDIFTSRSFDNGTTWSPVSLLNTNAATDAGFDGYPQLTTDGEGVWGVVWWSNENLNGTAGTDDDIFVSWSHDDGVTWLAPALLNTNGTSDTGDDENPVLTTDGAGTWATVWYSSENLNGTAGTDLDIFVSRSLNDGATWSPPALLNANGTIDNGVDGFPQLTTDGAGTWIVAWQSDENLNGTAGTDGDVFFIRATGLQPGNLPVLSRAALACLGALLVSLVHFVALRRGIFAREGN